MLLAGTDWKTKPFPLWRGKLNIMELPLSWPTNNWLLCLSGVKGTSTKEVVSWRPKIGAKVCRDLYVCIFSQAAYLLGVISVISVISVFCSFLKSGVVRWWVALGSRDDTMLSPGFDGTSPRITYIWYQCHSVSLSCWNMVKVKHRGQEWNVVWFIFPSLKLT